LFSAFRQNSSLASLKEYAILSPTNRKFYQLEILAIEEKKIKPILDMINKEFSFSLHQI
jgi:hypothetical protein